jgi:hypothetical protein
MRYAVTVLVLLAALCSCSQEKKQSEDSGQWVKTEDVRPQPTRQSKLTDKQLARVRKLQTDLVEVDPSSLDKWVEDFEKDRNPEKEIRVWEAMADAYHSYCSQHDLSLAGKKDVINILLARSTSSDESEIVKQVKPKVLTASESRAVMAAYKGETEPIEVERK